MKWNILNNSCSNWTKFYAYERIDFPANIKPTVEDLKRMRFNLVFSSRVRDIDEAAFL